MATGPDWVFFLQLVPVHITDTTNTFVYQLYLSVRLYFPSSGFEA